ncbi:MAG: hypothetical protein H6970_04665 [Gammaproteobacteria bacterium]|nr:hypothetical protein [Gammaproteobacteria bacterium]MCP5424341.1 hypothetical protein [Gammaproteobacteria bacterium]MCP5459095.1 hypothetical protein [Gammaproteobacteria bacterium]
MQILDDFSLRRIPSQSPLSELLWEKHPLGIQLDGVTLAHQFRVPAGYLLLLTDDCPYEEELNIYLLDEAYRLLDALELGAPYAAAVLSDVRPQGLRTLTFSFFGNECWRLEILTQPRIRLNFSLFSPVKRKTSFWSRRWLSLLQIA